MFNKQNLFSKPGGPMAERRPSYPQSLAQRPANSTTSPTGSGQATSDGSDEVQKSDNNRLDKENMSTSEAVGSKPETSGSQLIVGPDVKLKGAEILDCDTLVVEGRVEATMDSRVIRIAERGSFSGKVGIDVAEVHGEFDGELTARKQLVIHATGKVSGVIRYGKILIEEGGVVCGDVQSLNAEAAPRSGRVQALVVPSKG